MRYESTCGRSDEVAQEENCPLLDNEEARIDATVQDDSSHKCDQQELHTRFTLP